MNRRSFINRIAALFGLAFVAPGELLTRKSSGIMYLFSNRRAAEVFTRARFDPLLLIHRGVNYGAPIKLFN